MFSVVSDLLIFNKGRGVCVFTYIYIYRYIYTYVQPYTYIYIYTDLICIYEYEHMHLYIQNIFYTLFFPFQIPSQQKNTKTTTAKPVAKASSVLQQVTQKGHKTIMYICIYIYKLMSVYMYICIFHVLLV